MVLEVDILKDTNIFLEFVRENIGNYCNLFISIIDLINFLYSKYVGRYEKLMVFSGTTGVDGLISGGLVPLNHDFDVQLVRDFTEKLLNELGFKVESRDFYAK